MRRPGLGLLLPVALLGNSACTLTGPLSALRPVPRDRATVVRLCDAPACPREIGITFLGVSGFIVRSDSEAVMTGPSFTHPGLFTAMTPRLLHIHSDTAEVDKQLRKLLSMDPDTGDLRRVSSILIGHAHYDHLMDVPYLARGHLQGATIYGSLTTKRILMGDPWLRSHPRQLDSLFDGDSVGSPTRVGRWAYTPGRRMRFMALQSSHAPNWWFVTIAKGHADRDYEHLPTTGWGWRMGNSYAWLIDVLDAEARPVFRVLYQDAASKPEDAFLPPFAGADVKSVDVAIICAGNFDQVPHYPSFLLDTLHPKYVIVGHGEDFFHSMDDPLTPVRFTDTAKLSRALDQAVGARWVAPEPGGRVRLQY